MVTRNSFKRICGVCPRIQRARRAGGVNAGSLEIINRDPPDSGGLHPRLALHRLLALALLCTLAASVSSCASSPSNGGSHDTPDTRDTTFFALDGSEHAWEPTRDDGRSTLLVFATTWCAECRREQPDLVAWSREHGTNEQVRLVFSGSAADDVAEAVRERQLDTAAVDVAVDPVGNLAARYDVRATPTLIRLGPDGHKLGTWTRITFVPPPAAVAGGSPAGSNPAGTPPDSGAAPLPTAQPGRTIDGLTAVSDTGEELGTTYDIVVLAPDADAAVTDLATARAICREYDEKLSEWREDSEISQINAHAAEREMPLTLPGTLDMLRAALAVCEATEGAFDITWKPLGELWDRAVKAGKAPDPADLLETMKAVSWKNVKVSDTGVRFTHPDTKIGIAGFAKGWIIDRLFLFLRSKGYRDIIVNIGGDLRACGRAADGRLHNVLVLDPYTPGRVIGELGFGMAAAVATSGNYRRFRMAGEQRVGHIIDPRLGFSPLFDGSVTVLTRDCAMADALATALYVMGPDDGLEFIKKIEKADAVFVTRMGVRSSLPGGDDGFLAPGGGEGETHPPDDNGDNGDD